MLGVGGWRSSQSTNTWSVYRCGHNVVAKWFRAMTTDERTIRQLAEVAEAVATQECEAVAAGQEPCPLQSDNREEWCLPCVAKQALSEYLNA